MSVWWEVEEMRKLLSANFSRLWKDKVFWICVGTMFVYAIVYMLNSCRQALALSEYDYRIDDFYFQFAVTIGVFTALLASMFLGTEYSDGTIRNKMIVGHTRTHIYIANLITIFAATLLILLTWLIGALVAIPSLGVWKMGVGYLLLYLLIAVMLAASFSAICTLVGMLSDNKAVTVVITIFLILGLLIGASLIYNKLAEPEMTSGIELTAAGMQMSEPTPNPNYVGGAARKVYDFVLDFLPTGQGLKMWMLEVSNPIRMLVSSAVITVFSTGVGIFFFKRKDLK